MENVDFEKVRELFELNGWVLQIGCGNKRVFLYPADKSRTPISIPVNNKKVPVVIYDIIRKFLDNGT